MAEQLDLNDVLSRKAAADLLIERTAKELHDHLQLAVQQLIPFPYFPESTMQAIEAEPGAAARSDMGCIVLRPDGELYEFTMALDFSSEITTAEKREDLREVRLSPVDYIAFAYNALLEITRILADRAEGKTTR